MKLTYDIRDLVPYINWAYFYFAWQVKDQVTQLRMRREAEAFLNEQDGNYKVYALFEIFDAYAEGDDIVIKGSKTRLPMLRQQQVNSSCLCLSDFLEESSTRCSSLGVFATS